MQLLNHRTFGLTSTMQSRFVVVGAKRFSFAQPKRYFLTCNDDAAESKGDELLHAAGATLASGTGAAAMWGFHE